MPTILASIWLLHVAAILSPGANVLLVSQLAAGERMRSALFAAFGITVGAGLWATFAVLGVDAVFAAFPRLRLALQIAGGLYLLLLASRLWRAKAGEAGEDSRSVSPVMAWWAGFLTNITNPKAALFYGSVFAATFPADPSPILKGLAVALIVVNSCACHCLLALLFSRAPVRRAYARRRRAFNRMAGAVFAALGLGLLVAAAREALS